MSEIVPSTPASQASTLWDTDASSSLASSFEEQKPSSPRTQRTSPRPEVSAISRDILLFLIAFRILNALSIKTFFQPDEYFQSLEPAWQMAFGDNSGVWITWEWRHQLRSTIHPSLFAAAYWISAQLAQLLRLHPATRAELLIAAPKILQACFAATGDYYTWKLAERVYGQGSRRAWAALALTVCSAWQWFCSTRTLSNCLETTLTVIALESWPWQWSLEPTRGESQSKDLRMKSAEDSVEQYDIQRLSRCLLLAALACILRPTNILIWASLTCFTFWELKSRDQLWAMKWPWPNQPVLLTLTWPECLRATKQERTVFIQATALCGGLVLVVSMLADKSYYQQWTFPPLRFLYFNIAQSLAVFYGRSRWDYYITEGYPLLLTTYLPFGIMGLYQALRAADAGQKLSLSSYTRYQLAAIAIIVPFVLSFITHKEVRFIYPLLPVLHVLAAGPVAACFHTDISPTTSTPASPHSYTSWAFYRPSLLPLLLIVNVLIAIFTTQYHQPAPIAVMSYLRKEHEAHYLTQPPPNASIRQADTSMTVGFLMPCHSTPWRSHLIYPSIKAWALGCEPPVNMAPSERAIYLDEADQFYANPAHFLEQNLGKPWHKTSILGLKNPLHGLGPHPDSSFPSLEDEGWDGKPGKKIWPEYLVFFEGLEPTVAAITRDTGYSQCWRGWNSFAHDDWRRKGDIVVWCLRGQPLYHKPSAGEHRFGNKPKRIG